MRIIMKRLFNLVKVYLVWCIKFFANDKCRPRKTKQTKKKRLERFLPPLIKQLLQGKQQ